MFEQFIFQSGVGDESDFLPLVSVTDEDDQEQNGEDVPDALPIVALKNTVLFPGVVIPIGIGRDKSVKSIRKAYQSNKLVGVVSQRDDKIEEPGKPDLFNVGTVARIAKLLRMPDGTNTAILQGKKRFQLGEMLSTEPYLLGSITPMSYADIANELEFEAIISTIRDKSAKIIELAPNIPTEAGISSYPVG
jgi:ATP-dependent Lon protease